MVWLWLLLIVWLLLQNWHLFWSFLTAWFGWWQQCLDAVKVHDSRIAFLWCHRQEQVLLELPLGHELFSKRKVQQAGRALLAAQLCVHQQAHVLLTPIHLVGHSQCCHSCWVQRDQPLRWLSISNFLSYSGSCNRNIVCLSFHDILTFMLFTLICKWVFAEQWSCCCRQGGDDTQRGKGAT